MAADLVVGMHSMALVEACLLGRPVLSVQPGLRFADPLPTNRLGASRAVYRHEDLLPALDELLSNSAARVALASRAAGLLPTAGAARRVVHALDALLGQPRPRSRVIQGVCER